MDEQRRPGRFILSGSANLALLGRVSETLAGRAGYFTLHPMTRREQRGETERTPFLVEFLDTPALPAGKVDPVTEREVINHATATPWISDPRFETVEAIQMVR